MKKILVALAFAVSAPAFAIDCRRGVDHKHPACYGYSYVDHRHMNYHYRPTVIYRNNDWVAPAIGALIIGAAVNEAYNRNQQTQVVIQNSTNNQTCTPWTETYNSDGTITRTRTCNQ